MKLQEYKSLSMVYRREEDFSADLANNIQYLQVGDFEDAEVESSVGTRKADIVATGNDGILVIENQFGKADWDHWGRLEAYARLKEADTAILIAEQFEDLMIVTCNLRNEDSNIDWYLIKAQINRHDEFFFQHIARPNIDIQTERKSVEYSEFWEPVRKDGLFAGKPVPLRDEGWIGKGIRGISLELHFQSNRTYVLTSFRGDNRYERREAAIELFPEDEFEYELRESPKFANIVFPVMDKGKKDKEHWPEIREKLTGKASVIYYKLQESDV
jgi:hypothetical protein